jgi:hypothetical protein
MLLGNLQKAFPGENQGQWMHMKAEITSLCYYPELILVASTADRGQPHRV